MAELFPKKLLLSSTRNVEVFRLYLPNPNIFVDEIINTKSCKMEKVCDELFVMLDKLGIHIRTDNGKLKSFLDKILLSEELTMVYIDMLFLLYKNNFIHSVYKYLYLFTEKQKKCIKYYIDFYENDFYHNHGVGDIYEISFEFESIKYTEKDIEEFRKYEIKNTEDLDYDILMQLEEIDNIDCYTEYIKWIIEVSHLLQFESCRTYASHANSLAFWHPEYDDDELYLSESKRKITDELLPYFKESICIPMPCHGNCEICNEGKLYQFNSNYEMKM